MEKFPKIRFIVITILVITVINIIALAFVLRFSFKEHRRGKEIDKKEFANKGFDFLKDKLQLNPYQVVLFRTEKDSFFASANRIFDKLEKKRFEMIGEFGKKQPDTIVLYRIAEEMGADHGQLKKEVVDHLIKLRSYCTPEQVVKLDSMYNFMIRTDSPWRNKMDKRSGNNKKKEH